MLSTNAKRLCDTRLSDHCFVIDCATSSSRDDFLYVISQDQLEGFINSQPFNSLLITGDFTIIDFARSSPKTSQLI